jgi:hypothetical protein
MAETRLVVEHREQLWSLLVEAAQIEHMIICQYLMLHLALVMNIMTAIGAAPSLSRPNLRHHSPFLRSAATTTAAISEQLAGHVPQDLRSA